MKHFGRTALLLALICALCVPAIAAEEEPSGVVTAVDVARYGQDLLLARPIGMVLTTVGAVTFVAFLPFTAASRDLGNAGKALVVTPGWQTFVRCLGCKI